MRKLMDPHLMDLASDDRLRYVILNIAVGFTY